MTKKIFRVCIYIDELMDSNWRNTFCRMETVKEIEDLKLLLNKFTKQAKYFIEQNEEET